VCHVYTIAGGSRSALKVSGPHRLVPTARRQRLVDEFAAVPGHAVLVAQIEAAGVELTVYV
jgi:hypothetical protein